MAPRCLFHTHANIAESPSGYFLRARLAILGAGIVDREVHLLPAHGGAHVQGLVAKPNKVPRRDYSDVLKATSQDLKGHTAPVVWLRNLKDGETE